MDITDYDNLISHPINGKSWEGFVIENLLSCIPVNCKAFFYRTASGNEIDLLLQFSSQDIWAIEIKKSTAPKLGPGFHLACSEIGVSKKYVVYGGEDEFSLGQDVIAISLPLLMQTILSYK